MFTEIDVFKLIFAVISNILYKVERNNLRVGLYGPRMDVQEILASTHLDLKCEAE
jgi:hypothetical protein